MTTINIESLLNRTAALGEGPVQSAGRIAQGEGDHTGVHPRADVDHIINPGQKSLNTFGVATPDPGAKASYTQVYEVVTPGNSVFEMNDTSGSERIMLRHPTGVGINIGPDGAVVVSSTGRVDVVNEDYNLSVGGDGALTYKGNLRLSVTGDLSIDVGGQFSVTAQEANEEVRETKNVTVHGDRVQTTRGNATDIIVGDGLTQVLGGQTTAIKGDHTLAGESKITVAAGADLAMTSTSEVIITAPEANIAAQNLSVFGAEGTIGGEGIIAYVHNIFGRDGKFERGFEAPTFHGDLVGKADTASVALSQIYDDPVTGGGKGTAVPVDPEPRDLISADRRSNPTSALLSAYIGGSSRGIKPVTIDPGNIIRNNLDLTEQTGGVTGHPLTQEQTRARMRDPANRENLDFISHSVNSGALSPSFAKTLPPSIAEVFDADKATVKGNTIIGNPSSSLVASKRIKAV